MGISGTGFSTIAVAGQSNIVAGSGVLTFVAGTNVTLSTNASTNTITINASAIPDAVTSVFTRTGAITAQTGDYSVGQITGALAASGGTATNLSLVGPLKFSDSSLTLQNSVVDTNSLVNIVPNGTATKSQFILYNKSDIANASYLLIDSEQNFIIFNSDKNGTGVIRSTYFQSGSTNIMRYNATGLSFINTAIAADTTAGTTLNFIAHDTTNDLARSFATLTSALIPSLAFSQPTNGALSWTGGTILQLSAALLVDSGGTGLNTTTPYSVLCGGATAAGALQQVASGSGGQVLTYVSSSALPTWQNPAVISVFGRTGTVVGATTDYSAVSGFILSSPVINGGFTDMLQSGSVSPPAVGYTRIYTASGDGSLNYTLSGGPTFKVAAIDNVGNLSATTFTSTATTGTAPFAVSSTTQVANLNAATAGSATNATNATNIGITDDTTTNATMYPLWVTAATGNLPAKVSSTKLSFNPSTGLLSGTALTLSSTIQVTGHTTFEGVTSTGATGTGNLVYDNSPSLVTPALGTPTALVGTNITGTAAGLTVGAVSPNKTTWTATDGSGGGLSLTTSYATSAVIGSQATVAATIVYPVTSNGNNNSIAGVPIAAASGQTAVFNVGSSTLTSTSLQATLINGTLSINDAVTKVYLTNLQLSGATLFISGTYII